MKKNLTSTYDSISRLAVLSAHYNVRYDGLYDNGAGKGLLAILAHTLPGKRRAMQERKRRRNLEGSPSKNMLQ